MNSSNVAKKLLGQSFRRRKGLNIIHNVTGFNTIAQLYDTHIFYHYDDDKIMLNTSGWKTRHTKNCINQLLPSGYSVSQKDFQWFLTFPCGKKTEFIDGMEFQL